MRVDETLDDRWIDNMTQCEKLCFVLLDHQRRFEDKLDAVMIQQEYTERWMLYHTYRYAVPSQHILTMILEKLPKERQINIIIECLRPIGLANRWQTIYNRKCGTINLTRLRELIADCKKYEKLLINLPRRIWSHMTMDEVRQYIPSTANIGFDSGS